MPETAVKPRIIHKAKKKKRIAIAHNGSQSANSISIPVIPPLTETTIMQNNFNQNKFFRWKVRFWIQFTHIQQTPVVFFLFFNFCFDVSYGNYSLLLAAIRLNRYEIVINFCCCCQFPTTSQVVINPLWREYRVSTRNSFTN